MTRGRSLVVSFLPSDSILLWISRTLDYKFSAVYTYVYPQWAIAIGWLLACCSIIWVPIYMIYSVVVLLISGSPYVSSSPPPALTVLYRSRCCIGQYVIWVKLLYRSTSSVTCLLKAINMSSFNGFTTVSSSW